MTRRDLQQLSRIRLKEAKALLENGLWDGSYYLAGYSIECALKTCIAKATRRFDFPDKKRVDSSHSHNLLDLLRPEEKLLLKGKATEAIQMTLIRFHP